VSSRARTELDYARRRRYRYESHLDRISSHDPKPPHANTRRSLPHVLAASLSARLKDRTADCSLRLRGLEMRWLHFPR
jgi:hypothetical protein